MRRDAFGNTLEPGVNVDPVDKSAGLDLTSERLPLADRMKSYEHQHSTVLPRRTHTLIRLDGRGFSNYTKGLDKPFDRRFMLGMAETAQSVCKEFGADFGFVISDEISLLLTDFTNEASQPAWGGKVQKLVSLTAAHVSAKFNQLRADLDGMPTFDARAWTIDDPAEVANYFIWRQRDGRRNAIGMLASHHYSHQQLHGVKTSERLEMLADLGLFEHDIPDMALRGSTLFTVKSAETVTYTHGKTGQAHCADVVRNRWKTATAPTFDPAGLAPFIRPIPEESAS